MGTFSALFTCGTVKSTSKTRYLDWRRVWDNSKNYYAVPRDDGLGCTLLTFLSLTFDVPSHVRESRVKIRRRCRHFFTELLTRTCDGVTRVSQHQGNITRISFTTQVNTRLHAVHVTDWGKFSRRKSTTQSDVIWYHTWPARNSVANWNLLWQNYRCGKYRGQWVARILFLCSYNYLLGNKCSKEKCKFPRWSVGKPFC